MSFNLPDYDSEKANGVITEKVVYKTVNGINLGFDVCYPSRLPKCVMIFIHGGGWRSDDLNRLLPHAKYAALCGAVGVSIDYRLNGDNTDVRDGLCDCAAALQKVRAIIIEKYKKPLKTIVLGDSAGGYYAVCLGNKKVLSLVDKTAKIVDYVVDCNGIVDLTGKWSYGIRDASAAQEYSPLFNVSKGDSPVLIVHGDEDKTVNIADAFAYERALKEKGVECELKILHGAAHAFILFDYRHDNAFVAKTLKDIILYFKDKDIL